MDVICAAHLKHFPLPPACWCQVPEQQEGPWPRGGRRSRGLQPGPHAHETLGLSLSCVRPPGPPASPTDIPAVSTQHPDTPCSWPPDLGKGEPFLRAAQDCDPGVFRRGPSFMPLTPRLPANPGASRLHWASSVSPPPPPHAPHSSPGLTRRPQEVAPLVRALSRLSICHHGKQSNTDLLEPSSVHLPPCSRLA